VWEALINLAREQPLGNACSFKGHYKIIMDKTLINLYEPAQWTVIDWSQRKKLKRQPLAQALHAFYRSHEKPYPLKLETLKKVTGSRNPQLASFKRKARLALTVLVSIGFLQTFAF
jgi:hypothetical protein